MLETGVNFVTVLFDGVYVGVVIYRRLAIEPG